MLFLRVGLFLVTVFFRVIFYGLGAPLTQYRSTFWVTCSFSVFFYGLRAGVTQYHSTGCLGRQPGERGAARLQSPFPFRVFSPSPPLSSFPIPLWGTIKRYTFP